MHCVDLGESFRTSIYLQKLASIQPRTILVKFARSPRTDPPGNCIPSETGGPASAPSAPPPPIADLDAEIAATEAKLYSLKQQKLAELQGEIASLESKGAASSTILGEQGSVPSQEVFQM